MKYTVYFIISVLIGYGCSKHGDNSSPPITSWSACHEFERYVCNRNVYLIEEVFSASNQPHDSVTKDAFFVQFRVGKDRMIYILDSTNHSNDLDFVDITIKKENVQLCADFPNSDTIYFKYNSIAENSFSCYGVEMEYVNGKLLKIWFD